jgi:serine phosphatase RsbU (regulator of sigma subunit)/ligand-binding sensor domain-containing protein
VVSFFFIRITYTFFKRNMKMNQLSNFWILIFCLFSLFSHAQELGLTKYGVDQGLPTDFTKGVVHDELGFIWIATDDGLVRFDGISATVVTENIGSQYIKGFFKRKNGEIFVVHDMGISLITYQKDTLKTSVFLEGTTSFQSGKILYPKGIYEDSKGRIWVSENARIVRFYNNSLKEYPFGAENQSDSFLRSFAFGEDENGTLWMVSYTGNVFYYNESSESFDLVTKQTRSNAVNQILVKGNQIWIGCNDGIFSLELNSEKQIVKEERIGNISGVSCVNIVNQRTIYVGTWQNGLQVVREDNNRNRTLQPVSLLPYSTVNNLYVGKVNDLWACTNQGVGLLQESFFRPVIIPNAQNYINAISEAGEDVYVADVSAYRMRKVGDFTYDISSFYYIDRGVVMSMAGDDKYLWLADYQGIVRKMDIATHQPLSTYIVGSERRIIYYVYQDQKGKIWACKDGSEGGAFAIDPEELPDNAVKHYHKGKGLGQKVSVIKEGADGKLFAGGEGKDTYLYWYKEEKDIFENLSLPLPFEIKSEFAVSDLAVDKDGSVWLASTHGLLKYKNNQIERIVLGKDAGSTLEEVPIKAVAITKDGSIWAASTLGLFRLQGDMLFIYDESNGLPAKTANYRSLLVDKNQRLWIGTVKGVAVMQTDNFEILQTKTPHLLSLKINGFALSPYQKSNTFPEFSNNPYLEANFLTLSYPNDKTSYQIRLLSADNQQWSVPTSKREITIPNLEPGTYTFQIRAKQKGGYLWSEPVAYQFRVLSPWYSAWWAYLLYIGGLASFGFGLVKVQTYRLQQQRKRLEMIIKERTKEIQVKNLELEEKNKQITDSIRYAKDIQRAVSPDRKYVRSLFTDFFVLYYPKDMVSGDFFWFSKVGDKMVIAVVDCTGHGVPGAFMSMIGNILLNDIVTINKIINPDEILEALHHSVKKALRQDTQKNTDGMDAGVCVIELNPSGGAIVNYAGAKIPLLFIEDGVIQRIKGTNRSIGGVTVSHKESVPFDKITKVFAKGTSIYLCTDGFADQANPQNERFGTKRFMDLLLNNSQFPMEEQKEMLKKTMQAYMAGTPQRDDMTILGIKV